MFRKLAAELVQERGLLGRVVLLHDLLEEFALRLLRIDLFDFVPLAEGRSGARHDNEHQTHAFTSRKFWRIL